MVLLKESWPKCGRDFLRCKLDTVYLLVLVVIIAVVGHQLVHQSV